MVKVIVKQLDLVIAVSEAQSGAWLDRGYPADRIVVVANGVEAHTVCGSRLEVRRELGIPDSAVVALLAARLRPEKRVPDFVRAVVRARETHPELIGLIAGDGPDRPAVEAARERDAVRLLGHRDDIPRLLEAADIFVLASEYEAVPMAILEAMAAGLPVVATTVGGVPEIIEHGSTGLLVAPRDPEAMAVSLAELAAGHGLRAAMGRAGAERHRENWNVDTMVKGYVQLLQERSTARGRVPGRERTTS
jgi:glycosyltransferase involved in cell wall biosynthesis